MGEKWHYEKNLSILKTIKKQLSNIENSDSDRGHNYEKPHKKFEEGPAPENTKVAVKNNGKLAYDYYMLGVRWKTTNGPTKIQRKTSGVEKKTRICRSKRLHFLRKCFWKNASIEMYLWAIKLPG